MPTAAVAFTAVIVSFCLFSSTAVHGWRPWQNAASQFSDLKRLEGSSEFVKMMYHNGSLLSEAVKIHVIWYGAWNNSEKRILRSFISSISAPAVTGGPNASVSEWWKTVRLYTDRNKANVTRRIVLGQEKSDRFYAQGKTLTRLSIQYVIRAAVRARTKPLELNPNAVYLVLTDESVVVDRFCTAVCGFHSHTLPGVVGARVPFAWVGNSRKFCSETCAYPFAVPSYMMGAVKPLVPPNGDVAIDGMVTVIAHEVAEMATDTFSDGWYAGRDATMPNEIADLCEGIYGTGGGGSYTGQLSIGHDGATYNLHGSRRRYLVQWLWNLYEKSCVGPNAVDR